MHETFKCYDLRKERGDFANFLKGNGIDIGCGPDPLKVDKGTVRPWDLPDGDAQLMAGVPDASFDFVYSSHCLEHMRDVPESLKNWLRILKPGGILYVVVPDYMLYEKFTWPSRYNADHKQSFSFMITRQHTQRTNHWHMNFDMYPLLTELGAEPLRMTVEDKGYNYNAGVYDQTEFDALAQLCVVARKK
jgi:SAM-dependent methyltransferase